MSKSRLKLFLETVVLAVICLLPLHGAEKSLRVVSLSPSLTELICVLGAEEVLAGRSSACDYPESVQKVPIAGDFAIPNMELLAALQPDIVIADTLVDPEVAKTIRTLGIRFELLPLKELADYPAAARKLGKLLNRVDKGEAEAAAFEVAVNALKQNLTQQPIKVLILFCIDPPITCGKNSFLTEYIRLAGGESITGDIDKSYFAVSPEYLFLHEPEVVVIPAAPGEDSKSPPAFPEALQQLKAIRENRVWHEVDSFGLSRLGPRWKQAIQTLKKVFAETRSHSAVQE